MLKWGKAWFMATCLDQMVSRAFFVEADEDSLPKLSHLWPEQMTGQRHAQ